MFGPARTYSSTGGFSALFGRQPLCPGLATLPAESDSVGILLPSSHKNNIPYEALGIRSVDTYT